MNRLTDRQQIRYTYLEDEQPQYDVVYIQRQPPPRRRRADPFLPFQLGFAAMVLLVFVVDDIHWFLQRAMAAVILLLIAGVFLSIWRSFRGDL